MHVIDDMDAGTAKARAVRPTQSTVEVLITGVSLIMLAPIDTNLTYGMKESKSIWAGSTMRIRQLWHTT